MTDRIRRRKDSTFRNYTTFAGCAFIYTKSYTPDCNRYCIGVYLYWKQPYA